MNQEELKQRLVELVKASLFRHIDKSCLLAENIVNDLLSSGVTIRERGEWKDNTFCSRCGYFAEDDEGHILMSFDEFCPFCGADMRGVKDE